MTTAKANREPDAQVKSACTHFLEQARLVLPLESLAIVLLDYQGDSSKIVFNWNAPSDPDAPPNQAYAMESEQGPKPEPTLSLPLRDNAGLFGAVLLCASHKGFSPHEVRFARDITEQLALRLENTLLYEKVITNSAEISLVDEIAQIITSAGRIDDVYDEFAQSIRKLVAFDRMEINLIDQDSEAFTIKYVFGPTQPGISIEGVVPLTSTTTELLLSTGVTAICNAISVRSRIVGHRTHAALQNAGLGLKSMIRVPLIVNSQIIGSLVLYNCAIGAYRSKEQAILERLASQIAPTIESACLQEKMHGASLRAQSMLEITRIVASKPNLEEIFPPVAEAIANLIQCDQVLLSWLDSSGFRINTLPRHRDPTGAAATEDSPDAVEPGTGDWSSISTPIIYREGVIGSLELRRTSSSFTSAERDELKQIGNQITPAVQNSRLQQLTFQQAFRLQNSGSSSPGALDQPDRSGQDPADDLAHRLYSPLTSIKGYAGSLLEPENHWPEEVQHEFLEPINQAADRLDQAIKDLLTPAQPTSSRDATAPGGTDIQQLFGFLEVTPSQPHRQVAPEFHCDPNLPKVLMDPQLLEQVLRHLIDVALALATAPALVAVEGINEDGRARISVTLSSAEDPESASQQMDTTRWESDLRLVVGRNLLGAHGETIHADRLEGNNVRFWFNLPVAGAGSHH